MWPQYVMTDDRNARFHQMALEKTLTTVTVCQQKALSLPSELKILIMQQHKKQDVCPWTIFWY